MRYTPPWHRALAVSRRRLLEPYRDVPGRRDAHFGTPYNVVYDLRVEDLAGADADAENARSCSRLFWHR